MIDMLLCYWGRYIFCHSDVDLCNKMATQRIMLHQDEFSFMVQLCEEHSKIVLDETNPHEDI